MNTALAIFVAVCAVGAVLIRTFWDLKSRELLDAKKLRTLRVALFVLASMGIVGALVAVNLAEQTTDQSRKNSEQLLLEIRREGRRLTPADFQIRVFATGQGAFSDPARLPIAAVHTKASVGSAALWFELVDLGSGAEEQRRSGRGGGGHVATRFAAQNVMAFDLERYQFLESLNGTNFECLLPISKMQPYTATPWRYEAQISIRGRTFVGQADESGKVVIPINGL